MKIDIKDPRFIFRVTFGITIITIVSIAVILIFSTDIERDRTIRAGCIFNGSIEETGWNSDNYRGIVKACEETKAQLFIRDNVPEERPACLSAVRELASEGCGVIFLASVGYGDFVSEAQSEFPDIEFCVNGSGEDDGRTTYYLERMYQGRYLSGLIAGSASETGVIGYVAAMPDNDVNRGINAFALGVRKAAPDAVVKVEFTGSWDDEEKEKEAVKKLFGESADVIAYHQNREYVPEACDAAGIDFIGFHSLSGSYPDHLLAGIECQWDKVYAEIIRDYMRHKTAISGMYWLGIEEGAIRLSVRSPRVSDETEALVSEAEAAIFGGMDVFSGEIYDNAGILRCNEGEMLSDRSMFTDMGWFAEGVETDEDGA